MNNRSVEIIDNKYEPKFTTIRINRPESNSFCFSLTRKEAFDMIVVLVTHLFSTKE